MAEVNVKVLCYSCPLWQRCENGSAERCCITTEVVANSLSSEPTPQQTLNEPKERCVRCSGQLSDKNLA